MRENSNKSSFDKLFEDVMGDDLPMDMGMDMGGGEELGGDDHGGDDLNGDTVTLELDRETAEKLHSLLGELLDGGDVEDIEDIEDVVDGDEHEEAYEESHVELENAPDVATKLASTNNDKVGDHLHGGSASDVGSSGQEDGGKPKAHSGGFDHNNTKNDKVGGKVTGGNQHAFKA